MFKFLFILPCLIIMFQPLNAKVEAPNYNFDLDTFAIFFPQKKLLEIEAKHGKGQVMDAKGNQKIVKFYYSQGQYKFAVMVAVNENEVLDFFAKLPNYFLHDVFFQSLINRLGKQNGYKKVGEEAIYIWEKDGLKHVYSAACTITCFPIFYTVFPLTPGPGHTPLLEQMKH
jgi:hypothetical protein